MVSKCMPLQKQLFLCYHDGWLFNHRLMPAAEIPSIQVSSRYRFPLTVRQLMNGIADRLCNQPRTAGTSVFNYALATNESKNAKALCTLSGAYRRAAARIEKLFSSKAPRKYCGIPLSKRSYDKPRRQNHNWQIEMGGCFGCEGDDLAHQVCPMGDTSAIVEKLRAQYPAAFLTVEDLSAT